MKKDMKTQPDPKRAVAPARILKAALTLFTERGYHGTSVRTIASVVGLEAASLYHHFPSKQRILFEIFERTMNELLTGMEKALASAETIEGKLRALLRFHVFFHIERQQEAFLSHSELRSLTPSNRQRILAKRDRYERRLRDLLAAGVEAGLFEVRDVQLATIAILMMWSGVSDWFVGGKRLTPDAVADTYCDMTLALLRRSGDREPALGDSTGAPRTRAMARHAVR
jgi:AcrR family transcriptional regulator